MLINANLTLFNRYYDKEADDYKYARTYLKGVNWQDSKSISISNAGAMSVDRSSVFIPLDVNSGGKKYLKPKTFKRASDKEQNYTLDNEDIVIKGIVEIDLNNVGLKALQRDYDDVMIITKVIDNRYGSRGIQHFELEVK